MTITASTAERLFNQGITVHIIEADGTLTDWSLSHGYQWQTIRLAYGEAWKVVEFDLPCSNRYF